MPTYLKAIIAAAVAAAANSAGAVTIGYWNMDGASVAAKLPANSGAQAASLSASVVDLGAGFATEILPDIPGTTINILGPDPVDNRAIGFYRAATLYAEGAFVMEGFDFSALDSVSVSFAYRSAAAFTWDTNVEVDYRIGGGSWVDIPEGLPWNSGWSLASIDLGPALDGASNVDIRIRSVSWLSTFGFLDIDNVQVSAIPETTSAVSFGVLCLAAILLRSKRRRISPAWRN